MPRAFQKIGSFLSSPRAVALASVLFVIFMVFGYPKMGTLLREHTPPGAEFDTAFAFSPADAVRKATMYDEHGRAAMVRLHWTYDLAFPAAYGFLLAAMWAVGLRWLAGKTRVPRYAFLAIPFAGPLFDVLENASVSVLLAALGPSRPGGGLDLLVSMASFVASPANALKWTFVSLALAGAVLLPIAGGAASILRRRAVA
jgi:hypothetical protein